LVTSCIDTVFYNTLLKGRLEGYKEMGRQGRRCKQPLDDCKETRGYWNLKEEALGHTLCRTHFESGYWLAIKQATK
jgi:hypothetical protein